MKLTAPQASEMKTLLAIAEATRTPEQVAKVAELQAILDAPEPAPVNNSPAPVAKNHKYSSEAEMLAAGIVEVASIKKTTTSYGFIKMAPGSKADAVVLTEDGEEKTIALGLLASKAGLAVAESKGVTVTQDQVGRDTLQPGDTIEVTILPKGLVTRGINGDKSVWVQLERDERVTAFRRKNSFEQQLVSAHLAAKAQRITQLRNAKTTLEITTINSELDANKVFASLSQVGGAKVSAASLAEAEF